MSAAPVIDSMEQGSAGHLAPSLKKRFCRKIVRILKAIMGARAMKPSSPLPQPSFLIPQEFEDRNAANGMRILIREDPYSPCFTASNGRTTKTWDEQPAGGNDQLALASEVAYQSLDKPGGFPVRGSVLRHRQNTLACLEGHNERSRCAIREGHPSVLMPTRQQTLMARKPLTNCSHELEMPSPKNPARHSCAVDGRPPAVGYISYKSDIHLSKEDVSRASKEAADFYRKKGQTQLEQRKSAQHPYSGSGWSDMRLKTPEFPPDENDEVKAHYSRVESEIFEPLNPYDLERPVNPEPPERFSVAVFPSTPWKVASTKHLPSSRINSRDWKGSAISPAPNFNKDLPPMPPGCRDSQMAISSLHSLQMNEDEHTAYPQHGHQNVTSIRYGPRPPSLAVPKRERFKKKIKSIGETF